MQSPGDEDKEEEREENPSQEERDSQQQDGAEGTAEDCGEASQESRLQDQSGPEPDGLTPQLYPDHSGPDEDSPAATNSGQSEQENVALGPFIPQLSDSNTLDEMEDQDPLPEEEEEEIEELIVLEPDHPLVRAHQAALNSHLKRHLESLKLKLKEKLALKKTDDQYLSEMWAEVHKAQEQAARLQTKLDDQLQATAQAADERRAAQEKLQIMKGLYTSMISQVNEAKANVSQLQVRLDKLNLHLIFTQGVSEDLHSDIKAMKNIRQKVGAEKNQAEEQKLKQDLYVERLTKDMERLTQQIAMYEAQTSAQAEKTQATKEALSEAEMEMESLAMARKELLQQWNSSLLQIGKQDEAFSAMQEALRTAKHQVILLDREIEGYKKSVTEEQEQNETLTMKLSWAQMDCATPKELIIQKQAQQEALQAQYSTCHRTLKETERTLARLSKETSGLQAEVNDQRRQLEKESAVRLELENKIVTHIQQKLTHNEAAKYSQKLIGKTSALKKEKNSKLRQLENDVVAVQLESSKVSQNLDNLAIAQEALDEEIETYNKLITADQAKISSFILLIEQKQSFISSLNKQIYQIAAATGHEDLSPLQIKVQALMDQINEVEADIKNYKKLWMRRQETLVGLTQELQGNSRDVLKLQTEFTGLQQKKISLESQIEAEHREQTELEGSARMLRGDLLKLNTLLCKNRQLSEALEQQNTLMETDFLHSLKEAERELIQIQMKHEKTQEEKERLHSYLVEAEQQIMQWEKKIQLVKETRSAVDSELYQGDIRMMKAEIHRMEVRQNQIMKQRKQLLRESEATVARRETIVQRREAMIHNSTKQTTKGQLDRIIQGLKRKIKDTQKHAAECEQMIRELQSNQVSLSDKLAQKTQQLLELHATANILDADIVNLQDTKDRNLTHLVTLQSRAKKLQEVCNGTYQALATSGSVEDGLQKQMERVHAVSTILHRVCEEFPQYQGALRKVTLALAARTQTEMSSN